LSTSRRRRVAARTRPRDSSALGSTPCRVLEAAGEARAEVWVGAVMVAEMEVAVKAWVTVAAKVLVVAVKVLVAAGVARVVVVMAAAEAKVEVEKVVGMEVAMVQATAEGMGVVAMTAVAIAVATEVAMVGRAEARAVCIRTKSWECAARGQLHFRRSRGI